MRGNSEVDRVVGRRETAETGSVAFRGRRFRHGQITWHPPVRLLGHTGLGHNPSSMTMLSMDLPAGHFRRGGW